MWIPPELLVAIFKNIKNTDDLVNTCHSYPFWMDVINLHIWCTYEVSTLDQILSLQYNRCVLKLECKNRLELYQQLPDNVKNAYNIKFYLNLMCTNVTDVSSLCKVHTLDLQNTLVIDVSALCKVHTLYLGSTKVTDVSSLGSVHTLYLWSTQVTDVSALGKVHTLNLYGTQVTDVSALGKVHTLYLANTKVTDVSALGDVHTLYLW